MTHETPTHLERICGIHCLLENRGMAQSFHVAFKNTIIKCTINSKPLGVKAVKK